MSFFRFKAKFYAIYRKLFSRQHSLLHERTSTMALQNTHHGPATIASMLKGKKNLFFAGIGGISMNSLAHISHLHGFSVSGYDRAPSPITQKLEEMGITVYYEPSETHVYQCDALVYTVAMSEDNPEYAYAKKNNIPLISRADFLGYLMTGYKHRIGLSGTHGKSTTTGMTARILSHANADPTVLSGATLKETGSPDLIGGKELFVFEACEYMDSFLDFRPNIAVVLNIELDHLDYFHSIEQMRRSFAQFLSLTGEDGFAVINLDDENCILAAEGYKGHLVTFGRNNLSADYSSANEDLTDGYASFDIVSHGKILTHVKLHIPGEHSICDALASFAACSIVGIPSAQIAEGLDTYDGVARRMEKVCVTKNDAVVYTDYAHHPTEIATTVSGARKICKGKLNIVFQPHTYSRTAELFDDFASVFSSCEADEIILCDIYAARETNIYGVSSAKLAEKIRENGKSCKTAASFEDAAAQINALSGDNDVVIVMGAGDVISVADILTSTYSK